MSLANQPARTISKADQLHKVRKSPKRGNAGKFSENTKTRIGERDDWKCVRCKSPYIESVPHHIIYKSAMGKGTVDNGVCICRNCHDLAHSLKSVREWFEQYKTKLEEANHGTYQNIK